MDIITSIGNSNIQYAKKLLTDKKFRQEKREFIAEGYNSIKDIPPDKVSVLFVNHNCYEKYKNYIDKVPKVLYINSKVSDAISDTISPSGITAICKMPEENENYDGISVMLDNLNDPGNAGTIIRTAVACGIKDLILYGDCVDVYSPKVVRASMGGIFHINIHKVNNLEDINMPILTLDMAGENIYEAENLPLPFALAVGSESQGISKNVRDKSERILSLPMDNRMESLNAGVSLGIAIYQLIYGGKSNVRS